MIACKPLISPDTSASAQGPFAGVQFVRVLGVYSFFDAKSGNVWSYDYDQDTPNAMRHALWDN